MPRFTSSDGLSLHYEDEGDGLPLLCLAGLTRDHHDFDYVAPHLTGVRLIRPDYRGRGQSDWGPPETYAIPVEARDAVELLDHLGIERAAILGTSRGGLIAMVLAATAKDRLSCPASPSTTSARRSPRRGWRRFATISAAIRSGKPMPMRPRRSPPACRGSRASRPSAGSARHASSSAKARTD
ncbi:alpha/beta hydrolase fold [Roseivivax sediminis]|uniref:Alpha/beta hydrolase fold n=1 Tax=Roseivivax sediminis TaxID=936889 RepID=A0A1I1SNZ4_9RHOB|nr:alpha/beta hydrolase [Roseivivax sediminis]SFD45613.1 alpha/beta hydrolase fold [Roseivivax sediminis]